MYYIYRLSDQQFVRGATSPPEFDPQTEALQTYPEHLRPIIRTERFDGAAQTKKRTATAQEIQDWDDARAVLNATTRFDSPEAKMLKALAIWTAGKLNVPLATARQEILAIYRGLN